MRVLLDTQLLIWNALAPARLSAAARALIAEDGAELCFSVVSLWEVTIKRGLGRDDFAIDPRRLRRELLADDYEELAVTAEHVFAVGDLPAVHRDPFDRLLIAQARVEGIRLASADRLLRGYGEVMPV